MDIIFGSLSSVNQMLRFWIRITDYACHGTRANVEVIYVEPHEYMDVLTSKTRASSPILRYFGARYGKAHYYAHFVRRRVQCD